MKDSRRRALDELEPYRHHKEGESQGGDVLHSPVAEGMLAVRRLSGPSEAEEGDQGREGVGEVVDAVGYNSQAVDDKACGQLHRPQDQVDTDAYGTCPLSLFDAVILGFRIPVVLSFHGRVHYLQRYGIPSLDRLV